jgi:2-desacetyl-2-hydroxyethyl bacteriochlorophyllide A dehydrogenase
MRAVTFQEPGKVEISDVPEPELEQPGDAIVKVEACAVCGSDLHIYHGRVRIEQGFTIGHEFVGTVIAAGPSVRRVEVGDRVLGCFQSACGSCRNCLRGEYHRCEQSRTFGHGKAMGDLQGSQAEQVLVPNADLTLRRVPEGMAVETAIFAGDVMGTGYHAVASSGMRPGDTVAVLGLGPVGLCAVQAARAAGASVVLAVDSVPERLAMAQSFGAEPLDLDGVDVKAAVRSRTVGRGVDVAIDAVGAPPALELAISLARTAGTVCALGVYAERCELHMGLLWIKGLTLRTGLANVIAHVDPVLEMMAAGVLNPGPLITHRMSLDSAPEAYALYDRREALKILLEP